MIYIQKVRKVYEDSQITFKDICFEKGKTYALLGPSGCGKTTLLKMIADRLRADEGIIKININEEEYLLNELGKKQKEYFRSHVVGYIPQDFQLFEGFSVIDNLRIMEEIAPIKISVQEALSKVKLTHKGTAKVKNLSGGEKQRVAIARLLMCEPPILLGDEPTGSLNHVLACEMMSLLTSLYKEKNRVLIVVTHDESMASYFDQVIYLDEIATWEVH